jgi:hypothetical protein
VVKVRISIEFECFLKQKNLFKILKIVVVRGRVRGNFSQGGITSRTYRDDEIKPIKTPPQKVKKN